MPLEPGTELGRYAIECVLGEGAMGTVYRAFDARLRRAVAIKVLAPPGEGEEEAVAAALREARAAAAILHPNATAVFDADRSGEVSFIVMELVPGVSLRRFVGDASVPLGTRVRWLAEIGGALAAAHRAGVVHRDVKPENVIVRDDGLVKVLDFGIARVPRASLKTPGGPRLGAPHLSAPHLSAPHLSAPHLSAPHGLLGTPAYMAPEHVRGEEIDGRADQFGWGVLAYELIAGRLPWAHAGDPFAQIAAVLTEVPAPLPAALVPPPVAAAVLRALAKAPGDRFPTMTEAVAAIAFCASRRSLRPPPTPPPPGFHEQIAPSAISVPPPSSPSASGDEGDEGSAGDVGGVALREPDFSTPVDVDAHLALLPPGATCKGLFFIDLLHVGAPAGPPAELARLAGVPERRYVAFRDYPMADHVRLGVVVALSLYPALPLGEALRRLGQRAFGTVAASLVGRTLLGGFGRDLEPILLASPRAYRLFLNFGELAVERPAPRWVLFHARGFPGFLETYQVGVVEGVLRHCGESARVRIALEALDRATLSIELV